MLYVLEFLFTFFLVFYTSDLGHSSVEIGLMMFSVFLFAYFVSTKTYANITLCISFFVTGYRPFVEVIVCLMVQIGGAFLATLLLIATGYNLSLFQTEEDFLAIVIIELVCSFFITLVYYSLFASEKENPELNSVFAVAAVYSAFTISFPHLPAGNFLKVLSGLNSDMNVVMGSLIGQLVGALGGGLCYKFLLCEQNSQKLKEIDISNDDININF